MARELSLTLDQDPSKTAFETGSTVTGTVTLKLSEPKEYRKVAVSLKGEAEVNWLEGAGQYVTKAINEKELYVEEEVVVWRSEDSPDGTLPAGKHTYPFQFTLPADCPSSFKSDFWHNYGNIVYKVKAVVETGPGKLDKKVVQPITVVKVVSASGPRVHDPVKGENRKKVGHWFGAGDITINAELEHSAYNVGEEIPVSFYVENGSGRRITVRCELVETRHYYGGGEHCSTTQHITQSVSKPIQSRTTSGRQQVVRVPIPANLRPAIKRSKIINTMYTVDVTLVVPLALNSTLKLPVMIVNSGVQLTDGKGS